MKSLLSKRIAARKIGAAMKGKQVQQEYINKTTPITISNEPPRVQDHRHNQ